MLLGLKLNKKWEEKNRRWETMEKPKVGLITYCIGNQGSVLQCYATQKYLSKREIDCCLFTRHESGITRILQSLEYRVGAYLKLFKFPYYKSAYIECRQLKNTNAFMTLETVKAIKNFVDEYICTEQRSWKQLKKMAKSEEYMAFFSGSDQIWSGTWFLTNRIWFLRFCPKYKRVAWMPSFGSDSIAEYNRDIYRRYISEYQFLSVREPEGQKIINELTGNEVPVLPDPVYLLSADEWRMISSKITFESKYILMFFISEPNPCAVVYAQKKATEHHAQIIWLSYNHNLDGIFVDGGPREFISYIDKAELVLTDSFHASLFSIILSTPFYIYQRMDNNGRKQIGRVHNLLEKFHMKNRLIENMLVTEEQSWDCSCICKVLKEERQKVEIFMKMISDFYLGETK